MHREKNIRRLQAACEMILELAAGNYSFRVDRSGEDDILEVLLALLNLMAEHNKEALFHKGYVNPHKSYNYIRQEAIILDRHGTILGHTPALVHMLGDDELVGLPIRRLIEIRSLAHWDRAFAEVIEGHLEHAAVPVEFAIPGELVFIPLCVISALAQSGNFLLGFMLPDAQPPASPAQLPEEVRPGQHDGREAELMQKVYDFVLMHHEGSFPSIRALSRMFSTNEFKLKTSFQRHFGTSIYQLYNEQRLKKAFLLIRYSKKALKDIAYTVGFTTYSNFSRAFKIKFGCGPGEIPRRRFSQ